MLFVIVNCVNCAFSDKADIFHNNPCNDVINDRTYVLDITFSHLCRMTFFIIILVTI